MRMQIGDCCAPCNLASVTLKSFAKADGLVLWQHRLDNPVLSSDGYIYGYALEEDDSAEANAFAIIAMSSSAGGPPLRVAASGSIRRYKKWIRKLATDGTVVADSTFFWYTDNASYIATPLELPAVDQGWIPNYLGATADGELLQLQGDNSLGVFLFGGSSLLIWDSNNTTTTRRYTIVGSAVRDLASVPTGGVKLRVTCENDGTNAEQTIDIADMIGKTAADLATDLEAFPHIVSVTGTGGPYPLVNIDLEIVWAQSTYHFKVFQRLNSTCRSYRTWLRDWDTAEITATLATPAGGSTAVEWQLTGSDDVIGWSVNPASGLGTPTQPGIAIEHFARSGGGFSQSWRTRPTLDRYAIWGPTATAPCLYARPSIRNGKLIVGHDIARGDGQAVGEHSEWHEIDLSTGALTSFGGTNNRRHYRPTFASDSQLLTVGWDSFVTNSYDGRVYQNDRPAPNYITLTDALDDYVATYFGPYGQAASEGTGAIIAADTTAIYSCSSMLVINSAPAGSSFNADGQKVINTSDRTLATIYTRFKEGDTSRVSGDSYFSLANYYRVRYLLSSPINHRWVDTGMQWRFAFFTIEDVTASTAPSLATAWLDFDADETDFQSALDALLGTNDAGANAFVEGPTYPVTASEPCPQMIWQRGITLTFPAEVASAPGTVPPVVWSLNSLAAVRYGRIQVKAATADTFTLTDGPLSRMDWATGNVIWETNFGSSSYGGGILGGSSGQLIGDQYLVAGSEVAATCFSVYQWQEVSYGVEAWVLVADYCPDGRTASPPAGDGTFIGEWKNGTCVR